MLNNSTKEKEKEKEKNGALFYIERLMFQHHGPRTLIPIAKFVFIPMELTLPDDCRLKDEDVKLVDDIY